MRSSALINTMFSFLKKKKPDEKKHAEAIFSDDSFDDAQDIFDLFTSVTGMHFHKKEPITKEKIKNFCLRHDIHGFKQLNMLLEKEPSLMQDLIDYLTVNETYFFREIEQIRLLERFVKEADDTVHILCAPCSSGEEVYSIIIHLLEAGIPKEKFRIVGIDINASAIQKAQKGLFSERSVNRVDDHLRKKYFYNEGSTYQINPNLAAMASFRVENIFSETFPSLGKFDFIFSRNLFIYFDATEKRRAVERFCSMLHPKGHVFFGHADIFDDPVCLISEFMGRTKVYKKN